MCIVFVICKCNKIWFLFWKRIFFYICIYFNEIFYSFYESFFFFLFCDEKYEIYDFFIESVRYSGILLKDVDRFMFF